MPKASMITHQYTLAIWCLFLFNQIIAFQPSAPFRLGSFSDASGRFNDRCSVAHAALKTKLATLNAELWDKEINACNKPVLAFFSAPWCGPCRLVNPVLEEIDAEYGSGRSSFGEGKGRNDGYQVESLSVVAINTDDADPAVVNAWGVESIPTLLLVRDGQVLEKVVGAVPKSALLTILRNSFERLQIEGTA